MNTCIESNVAAYVETNRIKKSDLAKKSSLSVQAMSLVLNGKRKLSAGEYVAVCDALCVPYDFFIRERLAS